MTSHIYLNLGSNVGDRYAMIGKAVAALQDIAEQHKAIVRVAEPVLSYPQGFESENVFVNIGVLIGMEKESEWTVDELHSLLDATQTIEKSLSLIPHRNPDGTYRDREIDIDIITVDELVISTPRLKLPHPEMAKRNFVLLPMCALMPDWHHPISNLTPLELLSAI